MLPKLCKSFILVLILIFCVANHAYGGSEYPSALYGAWWQGGNCDGRGILLIITEDRVLFGSEKAELFITNAGPQTKIVATVSLKDRSRHDYLSYDPLEKTFIWVIPGEDGNTGINVPWNRAFKRCIAVLSR